MVIVPEGVDDALTTGVGHQNSDAAVVVRRVGKIPCFGGVVSPSAALVGFHVNKNLCAQRSHGGSIEREVTFERFVGQKEGVLTTGAEHVEGGSHCLVRRHQFAMGKDLGEVSDAREEVIFPGAYCAFRRISWMHVRWSVLEARLLRLDEFFDVVLCFVVHFVQEAFETLHQ